MLHVILVSVSVLGFQNEAKITLPCETRFLHERPTSNELSSANALRSVASGGAADLQLSAIGLVLQGGDIRSGRRDAL